MIVDAVEPIAQDLRVLRSELGSLRSEVRSDIASLREAVATLSLGQAALGERIGATEDRLGARIDMAAEKTAPCSTRARSGGRDRPHPRGAHPGDSASLGLQRKRSGAHR